MTEVPEIPDNLWDEMPDHTYCKCGQSNVLTDVRPAGFKFTLRLKCPVCQCWTDAVPAAPG